MGEDGPWVNKPSGVGPRLIVVHAVTHGGWVDGTQLVFQSNIFASINRKDFGVTIREDERINAQSTIQLFTQIENKYPNAPTIHIIADNARYYRCKLIKNIYRILEFRLLGSGQDPSVSVSSSRSPC